MKTATSVVIIQSLIIPSYSPSQLCSSQARQAATLLNSPLSFPISSLTTNDEKQGGKPGYFRALAMNSSLVIFPLSTSDLFSSLFSRATSYSSNSLTLRAANASSSSVLSNSFSRFPHSVSPRYRRSCVNGKLRWSLKSEEKSMCSYMAPEACDHLTIL